MMPRLGLFVRSMRPSQRWALGGLLAVLILSLLYSGSYAVLRQCDHLVHDRFDGGRMFCNFGGEQVPNTKDRYEIWENRRGVRTSIRILRFFTPMIRVELAVRKAISRIP